MDIFTLIAKQLAGINTLGASFILLCFVVIINKIKTKNEIEKTDMKVENGIEKNETTIVNFMKEVNESIKEERKFVYKLLDNTNKKIDNIDDQIKEHIRIIGELVGELRGKNESK
jgi:MinD-like ATPase involved in chromosome partitioning or flagellar assembly